MRAGPMCPGGGGPAAKCWCGLCRMDFPALAPLCRVETCAADAMPMPPLGTVTWRREADRLCPAHTAEYEAYLLEQQPTRLHRCSDWPTLLRWLEARHG